MRLFIHTLLALVLGFLGGWAVATSAAFRYMDAARVFDRDGGGAMAALFIIGPFFGLVAAIVLAGVVLVRGLAAGQPKPAGWQPPSPESRRIMTWFMAFATLLAVYLVGWALIDLSGPWAPRSATRALVYNGVPLAVGLLCAFLVLRRRGRRTSVQA
jgi:hypothetical protein